MSKYKYNHDCPFEAFVTNLKDYNNGILKGKWIKFPTTLNRFEEVLSDIGINEHSQEWFFSDFDIYCNDIKEHLGMYCSFDEINEIANKFC